MKSIKINNFEIANDKPFTLIAGPCVIESQDHSLGLAEDIARICERAKINFIFKASFDKANKTIPGSYRGPGWEVGLEELKKIKKNIQVPIVTDVHERGQCQLASEVADILQIPALLSKQIDLILDAARTGKIINIKKYQMCRTSRS